MNKRQIGLFFIFCSILVSLSRLTLTGNVIGTSLVNYSPIFALTFLLAGAILFFMEAREIRGFAAEHPLEDLVRSVYSIDGKEAAFVVDSSAAIDNQSELPYLIRAYEGNVYLPRTVIKELYSGGKRGKEVLSHFLNPKDGKFRSKMIKYHKGPSGIGGKEYTQYLKTATDALRQTEKHKGYLILKRAIKKNKLEDLEPREITTLSKIKNFLSKDNRPFTEENAMSYLKHKHKVSKGDIDVLATSLALAYSGKKTRVLARDSHIKEAVDILRGRDETLKNNLIYEESREPIAA